MYGCIGISTGQNGIVGFGAIRLRRGDGLARYKNVWEKDACIASMLECFGAAPMQLQKLGWSQGRPQPY